VCIIYYDGILPVAIFSCQVFSSPSKDAETVARAAGVTACLESKKGTRSNRF
jgi:hypothetical protein